MTSLTNKNHKQQMRGKMPEDKNTSPAEENVWSTKFSFGVSALGLNGTTRASDFILPI